MRRSQALAIDALVNLVLGVLLVFFPTRLVSALGIPDAESAFYPSVLGAVLVGIGIALLVERRRGAGGLGLAGAASINLCGGVVLAGWLVVGKLALPPRGVAFLSCLVVLLVAVSLVELSVVRKHAVDLQPGR
jgi:hypothetical protein